MKRGYSPVATLMLESGLGHHRAGRIPEAYDIYRQVLDAHPRHPDALHLLGVVAHQLGKFGEAADLIRLAIAVNGANPDYHVNLGNALQASGDCEAAVAAFRHALELEADNPQTLFNLGNTLHTMARTDEAAAVFRQAIHIRPDFAEAHHNLGVVLEGGNPSGGEDSFRRALEIKPDYAEAHHNLGNLLRTMGRLDEAQAALARALAAAPDRAGAHDSLGAVLKEQGRLAEAAAAHRRAIAIDPDFAAAHYNLAATLQDMGRFDEIVALYRRCLELDPGNESARHMVAALSGETTERAPEDYVRNMFDGYAPGFERHLVEVLEYRVPALLRAAVDRLAGAAPRRFARALDMGCGTGLVGAAFRDLVGEFHGVDLAPGMVALARRRGVYDALYESDVGAFLDGLAPGAPPYGLVLSADLFIYIGDLAPLFAAVAGRLAGLFVFSVESLEEGRYALRPSGRYAHSDGYIRELASKNGFSVLSMARVILRKAQNAPMPGLVYVLSRNNRVE